MTTGGNFRKSSNAYTSEINFPHYEYDGVQVIKAHRKEKKKLGQLAKCTLQEQFISNERKGKRKLNMS